MMMDAKKFGVFLQTRRKELGLTQSRLGDALGVTDKAISRWERGVGFPDISLLEPLADALEITMLELMHSERIPGESIPVAEAGTIVADSLRMAQEQERFRVRGRLLRWVATPAVFLMQFGLMILVIFHVDLPFWACLLIMLCIGGFFSMVHQGIRYIADCRYMEEPQQIHWPRKVTSCISAAGFVGSILAMLLNTDGLRQYYFPVTILTWGMMAVWPIYEFVWLWWKQRDDGEST